MDKGSSGCTSSNRCSACEGDCDSDSDCRPGLKCFQRGQSSDVVPGCATTGYVKTTSDHDYCYSVSKEVSAGQETNPPYSTPAPTMNHTTSIDGTGYLSMNGQSSHSANECMRHPSVLAELDGSTFFMFHQPWVLKTWPVIAYRRQHVLETQARRHAET